MSLTAAIALAPVFKDTVEKLADGMADYNRSVGTGMGNAISSIGDAIADRIRGPGASSLK